MAELPGKHLLNYITKNYITQKCIVAQGHGIIVFFFFLWSFSIK